MMAIPLSLALTFFAGAACAQDADRIDRSFLEHARIMTRHATPHNLTSGRASAPSGIPGIDSIPNFDGQFFARGYGESGDPKRHWYTNTVGKPPQMGGTTIIGAPIQPVNIELDDANGHLRHVNGKPLISHVTKFVGPVLASPVFSKFKYSSGSAPTQFSDAIQRAQYYRHMKQNWHTLLAPTTLPPVTMRIRQSRNCPSGPNDQGCNYEFALNADGTCCDFILVNDSAPDSLFDNALGQIIVDDIALGDISTKEISIFLFPNVFLFDGDVSQCCVLGFHSYVSGIGGTMEARWVFAYASWISPGLFGQSFMDVTGLSHEIAEIYNDPFIVSDGVHNLTPWWLAPNGECGDALETGDVIEGLPNATYPITLSGFTYHPQNEALLQWFEETWPSDALDEAYSYPDRNVLQSPTSLELPGCP